MTKDKADKIIEILSKKYLNPKPALEFKSNFELLIAVMLSAQTTDVRVNLVTRELFKDYNTAENFLTLSEAELANKIFSIGLYKTKAKNILKTCKMLIDKFDGQVPQNILDLQTLFGVGRKTANVVFSVGMGGDAIAVDTHVFRVSNRIGLAKSENVLDVEKQLMRIIDKNKWSVAHHYLIFFGREICHSQKPECQKCELISLCEYNKKRG